jgi:hypothetical protein
MRKHIGKIFVGILTSFFILYVAVVAYDKFREPSYVRNMGEFNIGVTSNLYNGLCGNEKIWKKDDPHWKQLFNISVCEDNVDSIMSEGQWIVVHTSCERELRKNMETGEEVEKNEGKCFGGGILFLE